MTLWLLVVTIHFLYGRDMILELPSETLYVSADRCALAGKYVTDSLRQDGTDATWKCVEIPQ